MVRVITDTDEELNLIKQCISIASAVSEPMTYKSNIPLKDNIIYYKNSSSLTLEDKILTYLRDIDTPIDIMQLMNHLDSAARIGYQLSEVKDTISRLVLDEMIEVTDGENNIELYSVG